MIAIDGDYYQVVEDLGFVHSRGRYAKVVETPLGERVAVKFPCGQWRWAEPKILPRGPITGQIAADAGDES